MGVLVPETDDRFDDKRIPIRPADFDQMRCDGRLQDWDVAGDVGWPQFSMEQLFDLKSDDWEAEVKRRCQCLHFQMRQEPEASKSVEVSEDYRKYGWNFIFN